MYINIWTLCVQSVCDCVRSGVRWTLLQITVNLFRLNGLFLL